MSDMSRLFLTVYKIEIRAQGNGREIVALCHTLRVPTQELWTPGPEVGYAFTRLGSLRWVSSDPRTHGWLTSKDIVGFQRSRIDASDDDLIEGKVDRVPLSKYPVTKDGSLVGQRSIEQLVKMFSNFAPAKRGPKSWRMPVPVKVAHAEHFLAELESRWPSQG